MTPRTAAGRALLMLYPDIRSRCPRRMDREIEAEADRSLLLDAALRALVEAWDLDPPDLVLMDEKVHAARAALAATDVRGALAEALPRILRDRDLAILPAPGVDNNPLWTYEWLADAILAALAAKGVEG